MEGEDALISQLVSYPTDFPSQTGCTDRHKSAADNIMTGGLLLAPMSVFLLHQSSRFHLSKDGKLLLKVCLNCMKGLSVPS